MSSAQEQTQGARWGALAAIALVMCGCRGGCGAPDVSEDTTPSPTSSAFVCVQETTSEIPCEDQAMLDAVRRRALVMPRVWGGRFPLGRWPLYLVHVRDAPRAEAVEADRGWLVGVTEDLLPDGAQMISGPQARGLRVARYDAQAQRALEQHAAPYAPRFKIGRLSTSMVRFRDADVGAQEWADTVVHETFHAYQRARWERVEGRVQDQASYPLTAPVLELTLLEARALHEAIRAEGDRAQLARMLRRFVALRAEKARVDPSPARLVTTMGDAQERGEGSARYVELQARAFEEPGVVVEAIGARLDPSQWALLSGPMVRTHWAWDAWYDTGAAVLWALAQLGQDVVAPTEAGQTPAAQARAWAEQQPGWDAAAELAQARAAWSDDALRAEAQRQAAEAAALSPNPKEAGGAAP